MPLWWRGGGGWYEWLPLGPCCRDGRRRRSGRKKCRIQRRPDAVWKGGAGGRGGGVNLRLGRKCVWLSFRFFLNAIAVARLFQRVHFLSHRPCACPAGLQWDSRRQVRTLFRLYSRVLGHVFGAYFFLRRHLFSSSSDRPCRRCGFLLCRPSAAAQRHLTGPGRCI